MESVYLLIPLSIVLVAAGVWAFFWAVNRGQFENLDESASIALEDDQAGGSVSELASEAKSPRS